MAFESNDVLFITLINKGRIFLTKKLTGVASLSDVVNTMRSEIPSLAGLTTLDIRNTSRGWTRRQTLFLR